MLEREPPAAYADSAALPSGNVSAQSAVGESPSTWTGTDTTLGVPHAVEMRITRNDQFKVWVNTFVTTAATRPAQSTTGAPEAP